MSKAETINAAILGFTIIAILAGPIVALWMTRRIDDRREAQRRRLEVYRSLMLTGSARRSFDHVRALNSVLVEFDDYKEVSGSYRKYIQHLNSPLPAVDQQHHFFEQQSDFFYDLLMHIGKSLGYNFDKRDLERLSYYPKVWWDDELTQRNLQQLLVQVLEGKRSFPIALAQHSDGTSPYPPPPAPS